MANSTESRSTRTEIIAVASGKGGTGKTIILASLGYALQQSGHQVLFVDADTATDGLSLFLLGPHGVEIRTELKTENTFAGYLESYKTSGHGSALPFTINRGQQDDHGQIYNGIISGRGLYGDRIDEIELYSTPDVSRKIFQEAVKSFFNELRASNRWDYVLVDTRGGFSFGTTDICALSDKFFLVTEPAFTSFYQDKSLIHLISEAATQLYQKPELRGIIVNKATEFGELESDQPDRPSVRKLNLDTIEPSFRNLIMDEFTLRYSDTYPIPLDIDAVNSYKSQKLPYVAYPGCIFSYSTIVAFSGILKVVTVQWPKEAIEKWNALVDKVSTAIREENKAKIKQVEGLRQFETVNRRLQEENKFYAEQLREVKETQLRSYDAEARRLQWALRERRQATWIQLGAAAVALMLISGFALSYISELRRQAAEQLALIKARDEALATERDRFETLRVELDKLRNELLQRTK